MLDDVLALRSIKTHCALCGRKFGRVAKTTEHIFPRWLQKHHDLGTRRLTLPNFIGKTYKSITIEICEKCNNQRFGSLESEIAQLVRSPDPFSEAKTFGAEKLAIWVGKIFWLLVRKGHAYADFRTRNDVEPDTIVPTALVAGTTYVGMLERAYAMRKEMFACYLTDPPIPELFYRAPYSIYLVEIDTRDDRFEAFDFIDNTATVGVAFRTGNLGIICNFDGGLHRSFRYWRFEHLLNEKLHPLQFNELAARVFYDQSVLHPGAVKVQYYWNKPLRAVIAQTLTPRGFDPYLAENHDPKRLAQITGRYTSTNPADLVTDDGRVFTNLEDQNGDFMKFPVTPEELAVARADPHRVTFGPIDDKWRYRGEDTD